jgi:hypothetical protein
MIIPKAQCQKRSIPTSWWHELSKGGCWQAAKNLRSRVEHTSITICNNVKHKNTIKKITSIKTQSKLVT